VHRPFSVPGGGASTVSPDGRLMARGQSSSIALWNLEMNSEQAGMLIPVVGPGVSSLVFLRTD
jgi:hypothetical protein